MPVGGISVKRAKGVAYGYTAGTSRALRVVSITMKLDAQIPLGR